MLNRYKRVANVTKDAPGGPPGRHQETPSWDSLSAVS